MMMSCLDWEYHQMISMQISGVTKAIQHMPDLSTRLQTSIGSTRRT